MELARRIQPRSDYWDLNFSRTGSVYTETLVAKRLDAEEREPLRVTFVTDFSEHPELATAFRRSMELGLTEPLVLPADAMKEFERHGPEWFASKKVPGQLELHPAPLVINLPVVVTLLGQEDRVLARRTAVGARSTKGSNGGQIIIDLGDNITFTFVLDLEHRDEGRIEMASNVSGLSGTAAKRARRFLSELANVEKISCSIDGRVMVGATEGPRAAPEKLSPA
ncbi:hypothetical protein [Agrococcus sediminis]|uniref:hypothetical protein n=1 Tax=Agrococcus sediminis TaxID=2599924 RepID=UPI00342199B0